MQIRPVGPPESSMPSVRNAIEAFVSGTLDYGGLQAEFKRAAEAAVPRDVALDELRLVDTEVGLSPALNNLIARAIDGSFDDRANRSTRTVPGTRADVTAPGRPAPVATVDRAAAASPPAPAPADEVAGPPPTVDDPDPDPVAELPPIFASDAQAEPVTRPRTAARGGAPPEPGTVLGDRYVLQSVLGRGGIGVVYRALDRRREEVPTSRPFVALKVLRRDLLGRPDARVRLFREAMQGQSLQHPNIVAIHDFDRDGELAFVTMELLEGERLRTLIVRSAPDGLPAHEAFAILRGILAAAAHLHARGFVHRDLTPANVLVTHDGVPKLLDFGLTRGLVGRGEPLLDAAADDHAHTPAYASPQLLDGKPPDPRDDVYALGVLAYELLTGRHPFGKLAADEAARQRKRPAAPKNLTPAQWRTLRAALSFDADRRPPDARALSDGLALGPAPTRGGQGLVPGLLAGTAAGVLLTLVVIHPDGPFGSRLDAPAPVQDAAAPAAAPDAEPGTAAPSTRDEGNEHVAASAPADSPAPAGDAAPAPAVPRSLPGGDVLTPVGGDPLATSRAPGEAAPAPAPARPAPVAVPAAGPGRLELAAGSYRVSEATAVLIAEVLRRGGTSGRVGFRWRTVPRSAGDDDDYIGVEWERAELADGEDRARLFVSLVNDGLAEDPETFLIEIASPEGGATLGETIQAVVRIVDDDPS